MTDMTKNPKKNLLATLHTFTDQKILKSRTRRVAGPPPSLQEHSRLLLLLILLFLPIVSCLYRTPLR
ncbi:hypothetical protein K450DRAFT_256162 [Umbelopsis ramanniana AG]|uniref:Uncharacterized protein n=1 Tax=Umbelopsis ramanniana AG TaxID=1314678 RepID=A0AAD5E580_UMBRA|nr:uncharacterized protein K450DRAFT_256162 [Umbelopsis ramanniana AG]KAI8576551.1 hypothetical protein K450DRAFT_256162 [Umbelopsis ramanniana AG]